VLTALLFASPLHRVQDRKMDSSHILFQVSLDCSPPQTRTLKQLCMVRCKRPPRVTLVVVPQRPYILSIAVPAEVKGAHTQSQDGGKGRKHQETR